MAFENDPEGRRLACMYAGADFDKPRTETVEVFSSIGGGWSIDEFAATIKGAIDQIPAEYRSTAKVELEYGGGGCVGRLVITYVGPERDDQVAARIRRCETHVANSRAAEERETYERLKHKFGT